MDTPTRQGGVMAAKATPKATPKKGGASGVNVVHS